MKYSSVKISELRTLEDCNEMIESIENDYKNYIGGLNQWLSGNETIMLKSAVKVIDAINTKIINKTK